MRFTFAALAGLTIGAMTLPSAAAELSPLRWRADYERYLSEQALTRTEAGHASGTNGAVTVAYNGLAARGGLEALKQGGNAIDAALTAANMQVALTAGAPISYFGSVREAIDAPDFFLPRTDPKSMQLTVVVPKGRFEHSVREAMGYDYDEADSEQSRFAGEGIWVGISRDPSTGRLEAASHNRNNSAAVAF